MSGLKSLVATVFVGIVGAVAFFNLYEDYTPQAAIDLQVTSGRATGIARDYLKNLGFDLEGLYTETNFRYESDATLFLEEELGMPEAHSVIRADSLHSHHWRVYFFDRTASKSQQRSQFSVRVSPRGKVFAFDNTIPDTLTIPSLEVSQARLLAETFLKNQGYDPTSYDLDNFNVAERPNRRDVTFTWTGRDSVFSMARKMWARVDGDHIGGFRHYYQESEAFRKIGSNVNTFVSFIVMASSIATFILVIFVISLFLKKYHDGEVGIKTAFHLSVALFALIFLDHILKLSSTGVGVSLGDVNRFNTRTIVFIITVFIVQAFLVAMVFSAWSVGESSARHGWSARLQAIDGLLNGRPFTLETALAVVRGYAFGFLLLGLILVAMALASRTTHVGAFANSLSGIPDSYSPALNAVAMGLRVAILNEIVFRFFFLSWLRERTGKVWPGILVSSLLWTLMAFIMWDFPTGYINFRWLFASYFVFSVTLGLIMVRFDLLTTVVTNFVVLSMTYAIPLLAASAQYYQTQQVLFSVFMGLPLVVAVIGFVKKQKFEFSEVFVPEHIQRISERERMARELEIARNVQMSLLPKQNPLVEGYDIAGACIPALEVGGDYYDFFNLGDGKIGIAIGDVSGKGVPAAIYMTLTKGILQSYASESFSPKEVLTKLNHQMYTNIERNSFVSVFYAVLDMKNHRIRFARAGHNPAILVQRSNPTNTLLEPKGIAVGLESGERFHLVLEEHEISLEAGDVITFYTDGFTEACDKTGEEYGEDRLEKLVSQNKSASANGMVQNVVRSVKAFVGNHPQHDDMTMVVIKALGP